jgi:hypothetical protein
MRAFYQYRIELNLNSLITSFFSDRKTSPEVIVISDDESEVVRGPTEIRWDNGLQIMLPFVAQEDGTNALNVVSLD